MEIKKQKLKSSNTSSNLKKYNKHQNEIKINNKNNNISNNNIIFEFNKNTNNCKLLKLPHSNNIFSIEKDKIKNNKKKYYEIKNNKLVLEIEEEKEKVKQNSYSGLIKTEDGQPNYYNKNISINKKSFIGKINNFSPFNSKKKKDISINNENINNNIKKNANNKDVHNNSNNKINKFKTLIKVKENKKKFTRTFSGYAVKRKSSMNNNKNIYNNNFTINNKSKTNFSHNKKKESTNLSNDKQNNNFQNDNINNFFAFNRNLLNKKDII